MDLFPRPQHMVFIMSGIQGSGKSHIAKRMCEAFSIEDHSIYPHIFCTDDYFMKGGAYTFDVARIADAHQDCFRRYLNVVSKPTFGNRTNLVIVDNTNLVAAQIAPYYLAAKTFGYNVEILRINTGFDICCARQTHNVPMHAMRRSLDDFCKRDVMPQWNWKVRDINIGPDGKTILNMGAMPIFV